MEHYPLAPNQFRLTLIAANAVIHSCELMRAINDPRVEHATVPPLCKHAGRTSFSVNSVYGAALSARLARLTRQ